jgi:hypothetical protein
VLPKQVYEVAKVLAAIVLPAFAAFYITLAQSWGWGHTEAVVATVTALATLLGVLVKAMPPIDGVATINQGADLDDPNKLMDPEYIAGSKTLRFKVKKAP